MFKTKDIRDTHKEFKSEAHIAKLILITDVCWNQITLPINKSWRQIYWLQNNLTVTGPSSSNDQCCEANLLYILVNIMEDCRAIIVWRSFANHLHLWFPTLWVCFVLKMSTGKYLKRQQIVHFVRRIMNPDYVTDYISLSWKCFYLKCGWRVRCI